MSHRRRSSAPPRWLKPLNIAFLLLRRLGGMSALHVLTVPGRSTGRPRATLYLRRRRRGPRRGRDPGPADGRRADDLRPATARLIAATPGGADAIVVAAGNSAGLYGGELSSKYAGPFGIRSQNALAGRARAGSPTVARDATAINSV